jgi:hypothetical protein
VSYELLGEGSKLAEKLGVEIVAVLLGGKGIEALAPSLILWRRQGVCGHTS